MIRRNWIARLFAAAFIAAGVSAEAQAGLLPVSVSVQPEAGNFRWTYSVVLPTDMKLQSGSYFTIYDFGGYVTARRTCRRHSRITASWRTGVSRPAMSGRLRIA